MGRPKKDYETVNKDGIYRLTVRMNEKQYRLTKTLAKKMVDYYHNNSDKFGKARAEAFMNLIFGTKGKVVDALEEVLGEETATALIAHELGVFPKEGGGDDSR